MAVFSGCGIAVPVPGGRRRAIAGAPKVFSAGGTARGETARARTPGGETPPAGELEELKSPGRGSRGIPLVFVREGGFELTFWRQHRGASG